MHPSGAKGDFRFKLERTDRSNLPVSNCQPLAGGGKYLVTPYVDAFRLKSKTVFDTDTSSEYLDICLWRHHGHAAFAHDYHAARRQRY